MDRPDWSADDPSIIHDRHRTLQIRRIQSEAVAARLCTESFYKEVEQQFPDAAIYLGGKPIDRLAGCCPNSDDDPYARWLIGERCTPPY